MAWKHAYYASAVLLALILASLAGCPVYNVWEQGLKGEAELARADQNRQITIKEAQAHKESSALWAESEVLRAGGAAKANEILSGSLGGPEGYLRWLFLDRLDKMKGQIIYIPTEAGMPILEAGRLRSWEDRPSPEEG